MKAKWRQVLSLLLICSYNSDSSAKLTITGRANTCSAPSYAPLYTYHGTVIVTSDTDAQGNATVPKFEDNGTGAAVQCLGTDLTIEAEEFIGASKSGHGVIYMTDKRTANVTGGSFTCNTVTLLKDSARKKDVKLS